jgi:cullin 1
MKVHKCSVFQNILDRILSRLPQIISTMVETRSSKRSKRSKRSKHSKEEPKTLKAPLGELEQGSSKRSKRSSKRAKRSSKRAKEGPKALKAPLGELEQGSSKRSKRYSKRAKRAKRSLEEPKTITAAAAGELEQGELEQGWEIIQQGITKMQNQLEGKHGEKLQFTSTEYFTFYTTIYNLCSKPPPINEHSQQLYDRYQGVFEDYINSTVLPAIRGDTEEFMLKELLKQYKNYNLMGGWLSRIFNHLDKPFVRKDSELTLTEVYMKTFHDLVYLEVKESVKDAVISLISCDRTGNPSIPQTLVKDAVAIFIDLNTYEADFEPFMLDDTAEYYKRQASGWIEQDSLSDYILKVEDTLKKEKERVGRYLDASTEPKLLTRVENELLIQPGTQTLLENGCSALLTDANFDSLSRLFRLFSKLPQNSGVTHIAAKFKQHLIDEGTALVNQGEVLTFVQKLISLHDKYSLEYVSNCFLNHPDFQRSLREAFDVFCNKAVEGSASAELLATFCDGVMKKGAGDQVEETMEKALKLLEFVSDKDLFCEFYRKMLARRLMISRNEEREKSVLVKLKQQYGGQFTSKMEGMVTDMALAHEHRAKFGEYLVNHPVGMTMSVDVLSSGFWPNYQFSSLALPAEMVTAVEAFQRYYELNTKNRKLKWIYSLCTCHVNAKFDKKPIELIVSPLQAAILLLFNTNETTLSYDNIKAQLNLVDEEVVRLLHSLSCGKYKILSKCPNGKSVGKSDTFEVNGGFTDKMRRIKIPMLAVDHERKKVTEGACVVRIMKSRKQLPIQQLVTECVEYCSRTFKPDIKMIKRRIEDLVFREFLERDKKNPSLFNYLA